MFSWAQRRKLVVFSIFFIFIFVIGTFFVFKLLKPAEPAFPEGKDLSLLWVRFFEIRDGFIDAAAFVENPNNFEVEKLKYSFKIYDKNNILIAIKEGEVSAAPFEKFVIFEPNIAISERVPGRVLVDLKDVVFGRNSVNLLPKIDVLGTEKFLEDVFPRIIVNIKNRDNRSFRNVQSIIVIFDENQNAIAVSRTEIPFLGIGDERSLVFTWLKSLDGVSYTEVFFK